MSIADDSGLILAARVGKHTDELIEEIVVSTEGKTDCQHWNTDGWGGYERVLAEYVEHYIGKDRTQKIERTNGILSSNCKFKNHEELLVTGAESESIKSIKCCQLSNKINLVRQRTSWKNPLRVPRFSLIC